MLKALRKSTLKHCESREEKGQVQLKLIIKKNRKSSIMKAKEERRAKFRKIRLILKKEFPTKAISQKFQKILIPCH